MATQQEDKDHFDRTANDPNLWAMRGADLHLASQVLRDKFESIKYDPENDLVGSFEKLQYAGMPFIAAMLQGYTIEVSLKQLWLLKGHKLADDGETDLPAKGKHNLPAIADHVGFQLSPQERDVLSRLSLFVTSYGRYPVTKKWSDNRLTENANGVQSRLIWNKDDHAVTENVIERLKAEAASQSKPA